MESVHRLSGELTVIKTALNLTDADFPQFLAKERSYFDTLRHPPPQEILKIRYVHVLDDLEEKRHVSFQSPSVQVNATII